MRGDTVGGLHQVHLRCVEFETEHMLRQVIDPGRFLLRHKLASPYPIRVPLPEAPRSLHLLHVQKGDYTLAIAICLMAPFAPTRSIMSAAFKTRSRADSISILRSAICAKNKSWCLSVFPNGFRLGSDDLARINCIARSQTPIHRMLMINCACLEVYQW